ncbi:MAG: nucleotidyltransferase domain-containing protein [Thermoplasmata archaeon]|nr:nucleotidyltransferase domain-containing protein [Thermoplasmata archaeon]
MKLHNMLDNMLDSKSKVRILRLLFRFPEREFTEREMARMISMSPNTVNLALNDLRKTNVFLYKRLGRTHSYRCDPDSILFPLFEGLFGRERQMRDELMASLKKGLEGVGTCILFGSFARNEEEFDSDLDILIVTDNKANAKARAEDLTEEISRRFSITLTPMMVTPKELEKKKQKGFIKEALSEGKVIVGTSIS